MRRISESPELIEVDVRTLKGLYCAVVFRGGFLVPEAEVASVGLRFPCHHVLVYILYSRTNKTINDIPLLRR